MNVHTLIRETEPAHHLDPGEVIIDTSPPTHITKKSEINLGKRTPIHTKSRTWILMDSFQPKEPDSCATLSSQICVYLKVHKLRNYCHKTTTSHDYHINVSIMDPGISIKKIICILSMNHVYDSGCNFYFWYSLYCHDWRWIDWKFFRKKKSMNHVSENILHVTHCFLPLKESPTLV